MTALAAKYDVPGPRYTSYPTVPYWERTPTEAEWLQHVAASIARGAASGQGASLYVHIPFCRALCHYCGCNTFITRDTAVSDPYVANVLKEWSLYADRLPPVRVADLHLGGGTPTFLTPAQLAHLVEGLKARAVFLPDAELSIEADPRVTSTEHLDTLAALGFRRLSFGVQDFDPDVQHAVHRLQSVEEVRTLTIAARARGFTSVNFDLIYGLPRQTPDTIRRTVADVVALRPDRIAFYGYAHVPWMKAVQRRFTDADVPGGPQKRVLYEIGRELLEGAGYREIGMDHFALEDDTLFAAHRERRLHRNFMGYTARSTIPIIGLGVSSIGDTWTAFAQNEKTLPDWERRLAAGELPILRGHVLDEEDLEIRRHVVDVMTRFETDLADARAPFLRAVLPTLAEFAADGLVVLDGARLRVTEAGRPYVRNVCMAFDARLARKVPDRPLFSRTV